MGLNFLEIVKRVSEEPDALTKADTSQTEEPNIRRIVGSVFEEFAVPAESTGIAGIPQDIQNPLLGLFREGTPAVTATGAAVGGFATGAIPFLDEIPGFREGFDEAREAFPKTFGAGEIAGTLIPIGSSFKAAKFTLKPLIKRILPMIKSTRKSVEFLKQAGVAVSEGALANFFFRALSLETPSAKEIAVFAAVDAAIPGVGAIFKKIKGGLKLSAREKQIITPQIEKEIKTVLTPKAKGVNIFHATTRKFEGLPKSVSGFAGEKRRLIGEPEGVFFNLSEKGAKQATGFGEKQRIVRAKINTEDIFVVNSKTVDEYDSLYRKALNNIGGESAVRNPDDFFALNIGKDIEVAQEFTNILKQKGFKGVHNTFNNDFIALTDDAISAVPKTLQVPTPKQQIKKEIAGIPNVLVEKAQKVTKEDFVSSTFEIPINELKPLVTQAEIIAKSPGRIIKSRTPDAPIIMGFRDGKVVILDGNNRYFEKLNSGAKTIKARFAFNEGEENLFDIINQTIKKAKPSISEVSKAEFQVPTPKQRQFAIGKNQPEKQLSPKSQAAVDDLIARFGGEIREQRRGIRSLSLSKEAAKRQRPLVIKALEGRIKPGTAFNAEELEAVGSATQDLAERVARDPSLLKDKNFEKMFLNSFKALEGGTSEWGRTGRQIQDVRSPVFLEALDIITENAKPGDLLDVMNDFVRKGKILPPTILNKIVEFSRNMKLMSTSTIVRSTIGNATMQIFKQAETLGSSVFNRILATLTGQKRDRFAREFIADAVGFRSGMAEGIKDAKGIMLEDAAALARSAFLEREFGQTARRAIKGKKGTIIRAGQNFQGALDAAFRIPSIRGIVHRRAVRQALQEGLSGTKLNKRMEQLIREIPDNKKLMEEIQEEAATLTFQKQLGEFGQAVNKLRSAKGGVVQLVIPFFNTSVNLMKEFIKRTPLNVLSNSFRSSFRDAFITKKGVGAFSDELARMATGTAAFVGLNSIIANTGITIHGRGPKSRALRSQMFAQGWQPYSIQVGDEFYSYVGFEPISSFLGAVSDFQSGKKNGGTAAGVKKGLVNFFRTFAENPFFEGIKDIMRLASGEFKGVDQYLISLAAGSIIPSIVRQSSAVMDPELQRRHDSTKEFALREFEPIIPDFIRGGLEPRFNPLGQKAVRQGTRGNIFALRRSKDTKDIVIKELNRLELGFGQAQSFEGFRLTNKQKNQLNEIAGKELYRTILGYISNPTYSKLDDDTKRSILSSVKTKIFNSQKVVLFR